MSWIGGPSKDLGEKEGSGKVAGFASQGASRSENAASSAALRNAQGGHGKGKGDTDDKLDKISNQLDNLQNNDADTSKGQEMGENPGSRRT